MLLVIGWVKQVKVGKWQGQYRDAAGKVRFAGTHVRKKDAERATILVEATADAPTSRTTWAEWEKRWVQKVAASTIANDESRLEKWIRPRWNDVALGDIKHVDIQNWIDNIEGQSPSSKRKINAVLSASLRDARKAGLIEHNPAMGVTFDKLPPSPERWLSRPEAEAMRLAIPEGDMREFFDLLIGTGFRFGEAAGLHWDEVDLENHVITAKWSSDRGRGFKPPKSGSYRRVPIGANLTETLRNRLERNGHGKPKGEFHDAAKPKCGLVFTSDKGGPLNNRRVGAIITAAALVNMVDGKPLGEVRIHDIRHNYASQLVQAGVPIDETRSSTSLGTRPSR